jgi:hypothetical protein
MKKQKEVRKKEMFEDKGVLFVPAGILIGMGVGFITGNLPAGLFIGLGVGFLIWAIIKFFRR